MPRRIVLLVVLLGLSVLPDPSPGQSLPDPEPERLAAPERRVAPRWNAAEPICPHVTVSGWFTLPGIDVPARGPAPRR